MHTTITSSSGNTTDFSTTITKANSINVDFSGTAVRDVMLYQNALGISRLSKELNRASEGNVEQDQKDTMLILLLLLLSLFILPIVLPIRFLL
jgi:hypothetical protein